MAKKTLYLMRHCETLFNVQHKSQGWCDSPITPRGREQCRIAGEELRRRGVTFDHFYSSTSERCCDTLELTCEAAFGEVKPYVRTKGLRECGFGIFEAKDDCLEPSFGPMRSRVMKAAGGESDDEVNERMESCLQGIMADPSTHSVLATTSGGSGLHFYMLHKETSRLEGMPPFGNCVTHVYEWEDGVFTCLEAYIPDFGGLDLGGMGGSGVPERWLVEA